MLLIICLYLLFMSYIVQLAFLPEDIITAEITRSLSDLKLY